MTERENALEILRFGRPERVTARWPEYCLLYHGVNHEGYEGGGHHLPVGSTWVDIWGTRWHREHAGVMGFPRGNPLAEVGALKNYRWPDPDDERIVQRIYDMHSQFPGGDVFLAGSHRDTLWEKAYMLVGMERMMEYFFTEPDYAREVLHRIMDFQLGIARHYLALGVEFANLGDDLGTQRSLILSPRIINDFLVPEYRRLFDLYKSHGVLINFHSCGHIEPVLSVFMDLGVDVLNPLQASANDIFAVREKTRGRMALMGGISSAALMDGPPEKIPEEVRCRIHLLGAGGGYFCGPDQSLPWPEENYRAYEQALAQWGRYPLA